MSFKGIGISGLFVAVFIIAGIAFIFFGLQTDPAELTSDGYSLKNFFFMIGGFLILFSVVVAIVILRKKKRIEDLIATGKQGKAKILKLEDTGVRTNENPKIKVLLEISVDGYQPYQVWKKLTVPMIRLPQVQPGMEIGVIADPGDPQNAKKIGLLLK